MASVVLPSPIRCEADLVKIFPDPRLEPQPALGTWTGYMTKIASCILYLALNFIKFRRRWMNKKQSLLDLKMFYVQS